MKRAVGVAMMIDGVLQAMGVAGLLSSIVDRDWQDQALFVARLLVGAGLVFAGRVLLVGRAGLEARLAWRPSEPGRPTRSLTPVVVLIAALLLNLVETTWFNWPEVAMRAVYTAVALVIVLRRTALPTT